MHSSIGILYSTDILLFSRGITRTSVFYKKSSPKVVRWLLFTQSLSFIYRHIPGESNVFPDRLSRQNFAGVPDEILPDISEFDEENFIAATMGSVVGEKITRTIERATKNRWPVIIVSASGGARMYEGMLSLMQMAKTSGALARHAEAKLPYISVLTNPTTAGVMASYASLGDIIMAEPKCMIGFAGPRVIRETTHQELPKGFQTAEFLQDHGLVDMIVPRRSMRAMLSQLLAFFGRGK
jgi:acetyl-CoA carboxylase carboxyl transferase subunit beta